MKINIKNALFVVVVIGAILWSVGHAYNRFYIEKDFLISQHISCDPEIENCFVWQCDSEVEECTGNPEEDTEYYKLLEKRAANILECSNEEECEESSCEVGEIDCSETPCTPEGAESEEVMCSSDLEQSKTTKSDEEEGLIDSELEGESGPNLIEETPE